VSHIIGIDLGTTNSLVCFWDQGKVTMIPNSLDEYLTPSVVSFLEDKTILVGKAAKERLATHPESTFCNFKRYMGRTHTFKWENAKFSAEELSSFVLASLKEDAERFLGEPVEEAVISVPAYFDNKARTATKNAGALAGLKVERIINEPSAAALSYMMQLKSSPDSEASEEAELDDRTFLVFDFGGGTLDVSLVDTFDKIVEIITVSGDNQLGGIDFDKCIAEHFMKVNSIKREDINGECYQEILNSAEYVKRELSKKTVAKMVLNHGSISAETEIKDIELAKICAPVLQRIYAPVNNVLRDSGREIGEVNEIVMVGGSSKMPIVQQYLKHLLHRRDIVVSNPDRIVAEGMGVYAGIKERNVEIKDLILTDVCPFSLGTNIINKSNPGKDLSSFIIERNSPLPISKTKIYYPSNDNQTHCDFHIFQGEEMYAEENKNLGMIQVNFPKPAMKTTKINLTFTYDINGILLVNAEVPEFMIKEEKVFVSDGGEISELQKTEAVKKLREFKSVSSEDEDNIMVREWGGRLYAMLPMRMKEELLSRMQYFEYLLENDPYQALRMKKHLKLYLVALEVSLNSYTMASWQFNDDWEDEEDDEMEKLFKEWENKGPDDES